jgi:hypothetical protein
MPEPSISTCMFGSVTIRKTADRGAFTILLMSIRFAPDTMHPPTA